MRILCLDVGEKRIGVAVSDPLDLTAQGVTTIWTKGYTQDAAAVLQLCEEYGTNRILCGLPRNMDGSEGFQAQRVRQFADILAEKGLEVRFQDERLTTKAARGVLLEADVRRGSRKNVIDKLAAVLILQSCLDAGGWRDAVETKKNQLRSVYHMSENMNHDLDMEREDIVELVDEEGNDVRFEHIMTLEHKGKVYICLVPVDPMEDVEEDELVIMRIEDDGEGNDVYATIEDDAELDEVFEKYLEIAEADDEEEV